MFLYNTLKYECQRKRYAFQKGKKKNPDIQSY